uniref:Uncharacterized protein n=1 Tax=Knipowitschia caucasica TaxID=637954 RepID=A0AAV2J5F1_KNICA
MHRSARASGGVQRSGSAAAVGLSPVGVSARCRCVGSLSCGRSVHTVPARAGLCPRALGLLWCVLLQRRFFLFVTFAYIQMRGMFACCGDEAGSRLHGTSRGH